MAAVAGGWIDDGSRGYRYAMSWLQRIFRPSEVIVGTRVLVCAFDSRFRSLVDEDAAAYRTAYKCVEQAVFESATTFWSAVKRGFHIVHILADVDPDGLVGGIDVIGTELVDICLANGVKLLWMASDNEPEHFTSGSFAPRPIHLVLTMRRHGPVFGTFLGALVRRMAAGASMPVAWVAIAPQKPNQPVGAAPEVIFSAGNGQLVLS